MTKIALPSVEYLRACFDLDEDAGVLIWRVRPRDHFRTQRGWRAFNSQQAGKRCGVTTSGGYKIVMVAKRLFKVHRIIFAIYYGRLPGFDVDHKDGDPTNNRPSNLREATATQNQLNKAAWKRVASGVKGVYPKDGRYCAKIRKPGGESVWLGMFDSVDAAKAAHRAAVEKFHGEFGRPNA